MEPQAIAKTAEPFFKDPIVVGVVTALLMWLGGWVRTFLAKRVRIAGPEKQLLESLHAKVDTVLSNQAVQAVSVQKIDCELGSIIPAVKITVKKVRQDLGKLEEGEEFNGDLEEAWDEIRKAEEIHRGMRSIDLGVC